jgi:hypothetical protein
VLRVKDCAGHGSRWYEIGQSGEEVVALFPNVALKAFEVHMALSGPATGIRDQAKPTPLAIGRALCAAALLILWGDSARAASAATCNAYVKEAVAKAQGIRQFDCRYDLNDPFWTTDRKRHTQWCRASPEKTVAAETARRRGEMQVCLSCRAYAAMAVDAAAESSKLKCGFSGPKWSGNAADHFAWCMAMRDHEAARSDVAAANKSITVKIQDVTHPETLDRRLQIVKCKIEFSIRRDARP